LYVREIWMHVAFMHGIGYYSGKVAHSCSSLYTVGEGRCGILSFKIEPVGETNVSPGEPPSRYAINQRVRSVLVRHDVDLEALSISSTANIVYVYGFLKKGTGSNMKPSDIDLIFREIEQIPSVRGIAVDLENWIVTSSEGTWMATEKRRMGRPEAAFGPSEDYRINEEERITDVLGDLHKDKKT
jgi:hypothetical protein